MWAVRIERGTSIGTGAVLTPTLALTCAHVTQGASTVDVRMDSGDRECLAVVDTDTELDVALLRAPAGAMFAAESVLVPRALWRGAAPDAEQTTAELCTTDPCTPRSMAVALRRAPSTAKRVEFVVSGGREGVRRGYSGGPIVEHDARLSLPRMVGIVRARDMTSLDVFDRAGVGWMVPVERIAERFDEVAALVETPVERDASWQAHWEPRSRGVATMTDAGFFFCGRELAHERVREHLERGSGVLVVTGQRGHGKSALLARTVTLSCRRYLTLLGDDSQQVVRTHAPWPGALDVAVLARGRAPEWVARQIAQQLGYGPCEVGDLLARCADEQRKPRVVIDAVDECEDPRALMRDVIVKLAEAGARVAIGALRHRIVHEVPQDATWVDLDSSEFGEDAITGYVTRRLTAGTYSERAARRVATVVGARGMGNFLVAELIARTLASREPIITSAPGWQGQIACDVTDAFRDYLGRFGIDRQRMLALLHPLAHARGDGLTVDPPDAWLAVANALRPDVVEPFEHTDVRNAVARAGDYLTTSIQRGARRLYHEGLANAISALSASEWLVATSQEPTPEAIEREVRIASRRALDALVGLLPADRLAAADVYETLDPYVLAHVASHLAEHGRATELLERPGLLLACDQESLRGALVRGALSVPSANERARVAIVHALANRQVRQADRAAGLCAALRRQGEPERADELRRAFVSSVRPSHPLTDSATRDEHNRCPLPYELISGRSLRSVLSGVPNAHDGAISALAVVEHDAQPLIISGGSDGAVRSWRLDGSPGPLSREDPRSSIYALVVVEHDGQPLVVSGNSDGALRSWRLDGNPGPLNRAHAHPGVSTVKHYRHTLVVSGGVWALATIEHEGQPLIISGGSNGLRSWRLDGSPGPLAREHAQSGEVWALATIEHHGQPLLISGSGDGALRSWRLDGSPGLLDRGAASMLSIRAIAVTKHAGQPLLISGGSDMSLHSWRLDGSPGPMTVTPHDNVIGEICAVAVVEHDGQPLVVSGGGEGALRSWRLDGSPGPITLKRAHSEAVLAVAVLEHGAQPLIISGGGDGALHAWRLDDSEDEDADSTSIGALAVTERDGQPLIISGGSDGALRSWRLDGSPGPLTREHAHDAGLGAIGAVAVVEHDGQPLIISGGSDGALRSWRLDGSPGPLTLARAQSHSILAITIIEDEGQPLIITDAIRSWRLDGSPGPLSREDDLRSIRAVVVVEHDGQPLIISGGQNGALHSCRLDRRLGPMTVQVQRRTDRPDGEINADGEVWHPLPTIWALGVVEHDGQPLIISGGSDGALRSWRLDGTPGPLTREDAHSTSIRALAIVEHDGQPLIISGGSDGALRSWRTDGSPGPLTVAHNASIKALAVIEHDGQALIISAGDNRMMLVHALSCFT